MSAPTIGSPADHETDYGPGGHRYNDDLVLDRTKRERAKREHPAVAHVIDWEELRAAFRPVNDTANTSKKRSHVAGFWSVTVAPRDLIRPGVGDERTHSACNSSNVGLPGVL